LSSTGRIYISRHVIFYAFSFSFVAGFLDRRASSSGNKCIIPFIVHDLEYKLRNGQSENATRTPMDSQMDSHLCASNSHTCDSVSKSPGNNINNSSAPGNVSPMLSSAYTSSNKPSRHSQIQQLDCENLNDSLPFEAENLVQQPVQH